MRWLDFSSMAMPVGAAAGVAREDDNIMYFIGGGGAAAAVAGRMITLCYLLAKGGNANTLHPLLHGFQCTLLDVAIH